MSDTTGGEHPADSQWTEYLYGDCDRETFERLESHLQACTTCRETVSSWREVMDRLDTWQVPERELSSVTAKRATIRSKGVGGIFAFVAAVSLLLMAGFLGAWVSRSSVDPDQLRAELKESLEQDIERMMRDRRVEIQAELREELLAASEEKARLEATRVSAFLLASFQLEHDEAARLVQQQFQDLFDAQYALDQKLENVAADANVGLKRAYFGLDQLAMRVGSKKTSDPPSEM